MKTTRKFDYQWIIVALSFLMIVVSMGICTTIKGIYVSPITETLGIPLMHLAYDFYGSYNSAFIISAVFMVAVFVVFNLVLNSAKKLKFQDNAEVTLQFKALL